MLFERIESKGLAHYSYLIGDGREAIVIDPRRDCDVYVRRAALEGMRIVAVLETHRNEDYVVGSVELATQSGAEVFHADAHLSYGYGQPVREGQSWRVGGLRVEAIPSPGHTPGSMSYLLHDPQGHPWAVCTGDALFAGEVGRVDFMGPEHLGEMAALLYETLFGRLLPLGDEVIVCPAHGSGSVCGTAIADRPWTTIGLERRYNRRLQHSEREAFVADVGRALPIAPYFARMEALNVEGAPVLGVLPTPPPCTPAAFEALAAEGATILDARDELSFAAAHVPGALAIPEVNLPRFAGWFVPPDRPVLLVTDTDDTSQAVRYLVRLGFDQFAGALAGGMLSWHASGRASARLKVLPAAEFCEQVRRGAALWVLDIRTEGEIGQVPPVPGSHLIPLHELPDRIGEVPTDRPVAVVCGSGLRATTVGSMLLRAGCRDVAAVLGGIAACATILGRRP